MFEESDPLFMLYVFSTLVLVVLFFGIRYRRQRQIHVPLMLAAFITDLVLVLIIEMNRHAVEKAVSSVDNPLIMFHVGVSTLTLVSYTLLTISGTKILKSTEGTPTGHLLFHKKMAYVFIILRLTNYVTSFFVGTV